MRCRYSFKESPSVTRTLGLGGPEDEDEPEATEAEAEADMDGMADKIQNDARMRGAAAGGDNKK